MPLLALIPQLDRSTPRPLVAERLVPPKLAAEEAIGLEPVETSVGLVWTRYDGTRLPLGRIVPRTLEARFDTVSHLRRWWYATATTTTLRHDMLTGKRRVFPLLIVGRRADAVDEDGVPLGFQRTRATKGVNSSLRLYRGTVPLKSPPDLFGGENDVEIGLNAAPTGRFIAGTLPIRVSRAVRPRPFLWRRDDVAPKALPLPPGYTEGTVKALNSRGDVVGTVWAESLPSRVAFWPAEGGVKLLPVASTHSDNRIRDDGNSARWAAGDPLLVTEDGLVVSREYVRASPYEFITTLWDGKRTMWLPDAIAGVNAIAFEGLELSAGGHGFLVEIGQAPGMQAGDFGWYRVSPR